MKRRERAGDYSPFGLVASVWIVTSCIAAGAAAILAPYVGVSSALLAAAAIPAGMSLSGST